MAVSAFCLAERPWAGAPASLRMVLPRDGQKANYFHNQNVNKWRDFMDISMEINNFQTKYEPSSESLAVNIAVFHNSTDSGDSFSCCCYGVSS